MEEDRRKNSRKSAGRKPKSDLAVHRYMVRLSSEESKRFDIQFQKSRLKERLEFIKTMTFDKEIEVVRIDKATMNYYICLTDLYHQFQSIDDNYNQMVEAVKTNFGGKQAFVLLYDLERVTIDLILLSKRIIILTREFEENYLMEQRKKEENGG